jgi:hypothetical protein
MTIVIPRSVWKARYSNGFRVIGTGAWLAAGKQLWLHHSVTNPPGPNATLEQDCAHMREFEAIGQARFQGGISYTWVVMPSGRVFEGHSIDRQGAHTYGYNDTGRAICLAGNYDVNDLPKRMQDAVSALLRELGATLDGPHSQVYATACPGKYARAKIQSINTTAVSGLPIGNPINGDEDNEMGFDFNQVKLPETGTTETVEHEVIFPDMGGAMGVVDRWVKVHGPGQPFVDSTQTSRREAVLELSHFLNDAGNIVGTYEVDDFVLVHHETGPSVQVPPTASKLVLKYHSVKGLNVGVQTKTS